MNATALEIQKELRALASAEIAEHSRRFFKTGKGQYAEGDTFLGIRVPVLRKQVRKHSGLALEQTAVLLKSPFHEERLFALLMLVESFRRSSSAEKKVIYALYLNHTSHINNWDLVDSSAEHIVGAFLNDGDKAPIYRLARSENMWERRVAIVATFHYIKQGRFDDTLKVAQILLTDKQDLIHKAVGWMLREVGKRNPTREEAFLKKHYLTMPRTTLRYAIEKFPEEKRQDYLKGRI